MEQSTTLQVFPQGWYGVCIVVAVFTLLVAGTAKMRIIEGLIKILVLASALIGIYGRIYILYLAGLWPAALYIPIDQGQAIGFYNGYIEVNMYNLSSLNFVVPFIIAALLNWKAEFHIPISKLQLFAALIFSLLLVILSGRRAIWLVVALSPIFVLVMRLFLPHNLRHATHRNVITTTFGIVILLTFASILLNDIYGFKWSSVFNDFALGFNFSSNPSAHIRQTQLIVLLNGWKDAPFFLELEQELLP